MQYTVLDIGINKLLGTFSTESEALALARALVDANGVDYTDDLSIGWMDDAGRYGEPLSGAALLARIRELSQRREPVAAGQPSPERS